MARSPTGAPAGHRVGGRRQGACLDPLVQRPFRCPSFLRGARQSLSTKTLRVSTCRHAEARPARSGALPEIDCAIGDPAEPFDHVLCSDSGGQHRKRLRVCRRCVRGTSSQSAPSGWRAHRYSAFAADDCPRIPSCPSVGRRRRSEADCAWRRRLIGQPPSRQDQPRNRSDATLVGTIHLHVGQDSSASCDGRPGSERPINRPAG